MQGITEITPLYTKVEGLAGPNAIQWDSRVATSSIPRETLSRLLRSQTSGDDADSRLQIVRLLFGAQRYNDARIELEQAMRDFPELDKLQDLLVELKQYSAQRLLNEIKLRKEAGQHQRVQAFLRAFPDQGVARQTMLEVSELLREYQDAVKQSQQATTQLKQHGESLKNAHWKTVVDDLSTEWEHHLNINTLGKLSDYQRLADDPDMPEENKLALLVSGWLVGTGAASQNMAEAASMFRTRDLVREYLAESNPQQRATILEKLGQEEAGTPKRVAEILAQMPPPIHTTAQEGQPPGQFEIEVKFGGETFPYVVQLPEQYDPFLRYPTIVTLHASGRSPLDQIDWWAGEYSEKHNMRLGQASRHGYIVLAPKWTQAGQNRYQYSSREHAAVLSCLRDAKRRFAIDTDRVFLTGHSIGGDAAWDIGLSHPDLWAGVIPIVAVADYGPKAPKYVSRYWENARYVPLYFVAGELDGDKMTQNGRDFDRYMTRPRYDVMLVEYIGRGHEHFFDEIHRLFDWMKLHRRTWVRKEFACNSMRNQDNFFWCLELDQLPQKSIVRPLEWPAPSGTRPATTEFRVYVNNRIGVKDRRQESHALVVTGMDRPESSIKRDGQRPYATIRGRSKCRRDPGRCQNTGGSTPPRSGSAWIWKLASGTSGFLIGLR